MLHLVRENIRNLKPYASARDEFSGQAEVWLDANENPFENGLNRYPDPYQKTLKEAISALKGVDASRIFLGNGSDEVIDNLFRVFCEPKQDNVIILPPTYGMYKVSAGINDVKVRTVLLTSDFQPNVEGILKAADDQTKLIFVCSPNNPTGTAVKEDILVELLEKAPGLIVVDEAYVDFSKQDSALRLLQKYPNLLVMQTFSKAWGMAGIRLGMGFASPEIIQVMNKVKAPYNLSTLCQQVALEALGKVQKVKDEVKELLRQREWLTDQLEQVPMVEKIYPSDTNFLLARVKQPTALYTFLMKQGIIVRDRSHEPLCENCLRFTVGTHEENKKLLLGINEFALTLAEK